MELAEALLAQGRQLLAAGERGRARGRLREEQLRRIGKEPERPGLELRWAADARDARVTLQTEVDIAAAVVTWELPA